MAWTASRFFRATYADIFDNTTAIDLGADVPKVALFDSSVTPNQDVASSATAYNAGVWVTGDEVSDAGQWAAGGVALASTSLNSGTAGVVFYDSADPASGSSFTGADITGCLVYDDSVTTPVADIGLSYHYFGGSQSITDGTFTCIVNSLGWWRATLA